MPEKKKKKNGESCEARIKTKAKKGPVGKIEFWITKLELEKIKQNDKGRWRG